MTVRTNNKFGQTLPLTFGEVVQKSGNRIFIRRFPIEPLTAEFEPSAYNINASGSYPKYRANVYNRFQGYGNKSGYEASVYDFYVTDGVYADNFIKLKRNDGGVVDIDLSSVVGWY